MTYAIQYLPQAVENIKNIKDYISQDNPPAAQKLTDTIKTRIESLQTMPRKYEEYSENPAFRKIVVGSYLVFYKIDEAKKVVKIHRVLHGKQNISKMMNLVEN